MVETQAGKSALPWDHPWNMGPIGVTGAASANEVCAKADLVIGVRLPDDAVMRVGTEAYIAHLLVIELLMIMHIKALVPQAAQHLALFRQVLQAHGQDVDKHPSMQWTWSQTERSQAS